MSAINSSEKSPFFNLLLTMAPTLKRVGMLSVFVNLLALLPAVFSMQVFDRVIYRSGLNTLTALLIGMGIFVAAEFILRLSRGNLMRVAAAQVDAQGNQMLMDKLLAAPMQTLESKGTAAWYSFFTDIDVVRTTVSGSVAMTLLDIPFAVLAICLVALVATPVLPVVLIGGAVLAALSWYCSAEEPASRTAEFKLARRKDEITAEICRSRLTIKALGQDDSSKHIWINHYNAWAEESFEKNARAESQRELSQVILTIVSLAITATGAWCVVNQSMTVGSLIAANMLAMRAINPIAALCGQWRAMAQAKQSFERIEQLLGEVDEKKHSGLNVPTPSGKFELQAVSFSHQDSEVAVLKEVSAKFGPTGMIALAGENGSGKSTMLKLLRGLYEPTEGRVMLDEYDLAQFSRQEIGQWVSFLPQTPVLFEGSIADNVKRAYPQASDEEVLRACKIAGVHEFASQMKNGYATEVGEGGAKLSGGQRKKIAIAQALVSDAPVLLLDEPTNDLDYKSETALVHALKLLSQKKTIIIVTHSVRLMSNCDTVGYLGRDGKFYMAPAAAMIERLYGISIKKAVAEQKNPATSSVSAQPAAALAATAANA